MKKSLLFFTVAIILLIALVQKTEVSAKQPTGYGLTYCVIHGHTDIACGPGATQACGSVRYCY